MKQAQLVGPEHEEKLALLYRSLPKFITNPMDVNIYVKNYKVITDDIRARRELAKEYVKKLKEILKKQKTLETNAAKEKNETKAVINMYKEELGELLEIGRAHV